MKKLHFLLLVSLLALPAGCDSDSDSDNNQNNNNGAKELPADIAAEVVTTYAQIVAESYADSVATAKAMDTAIDTFIATPTEPNFEAAQNAWLAAREPYLQTEVYRFYDGPIDNPTDGPEGLINAWPLDEVYIDYVDGMPNAGIVNDTNVTLDAATIEGLNQAEGIEENVATGFHAIEFLLWGQDMNDAGPGQRPFTDYVTGENGTAANQARRGQYLGIVSDMLVGHLEAVQAAWAANDMSNYRAEFEAAAADEAVRRILTGMIVLTGFETGGERLQPALDNKSQEDEHSCFSDNTHRDMIQDVQGVLNVWQGSYGNTSGKGIQDIVEAVDTDLAGKVDAALKDSLAKANALMVPFDQEITAGNTEGNARVQALIDSLRTTESLLQDVFRLFDLTIPVTE